jgi:hypothetical protein
MISAGVVAVSMVTVPARAGDLFLHVDVQELEDGAHIQVNLPVALVEKGIGLMPRPFEIEGRITVGDWRLSRSDLERLHAAVRELEPRAETTLRIGGRKVDATLDRDQVVVDARARHWWDEEIHLSIPFVVLEAFLAGPSEGLDLVAGLHALAQREGTIVIEDDDALSRARVWVDAESDARR